MLPVLLGVFDSRVSDSELRPTDAGDGADTCTAVDPSGPILSTGQVTISADLPTFPGSLDFGLLVDISGSYR